MRTVLFVDDDPNFLELITRAFASWSHNSYQIDTATSPGEALCQLETSTVDLLVADLRMPVLDGIQLLRLVSRRHPKIHKVILTGYLGDADHHLCSASGAELILEKPVGRAGMETFFQAITSLLATDTTTEGFIGSLKQADLRDLVQMFCGSGASLILEIHSASISGRIYFEAGRIVHALTEQGKIAFPAFCDFMSLRGGDFQIKPYEPPGNRTLSESWEYLVLEAARLLDEQQETTVENDLESESLANLALEDIEMTFRSHLEAPPDPPPSPPDPPPPAPPASREAEFISRYVLPPA